MTNSRTAISRRSLLAGSLATAAACGVPRAPMAAATRQRVLVLVELNGGNDSLNMVVPYADPAYRQARPALALPRDRIAQLDERIGLNLALAPLRETWEGGDMTVVMGLGYPRPNRSHFRSIEIWNSASDSETYVSEGWVSRVLSGQDGKPAVQATDAVVLGGQAGPLAGAGLRSIVMRQPDRFLQRASAVGDGPADDSNPALSHILGVRRNLQASAQEIEAHMTRARGLDLDMPQGPLGRQLETAARLILSGVPLRAIKVSQSGYDTHAGQAGPHRNLLEELGEALAAFRQALQRGGRWEDVLVMTYAEFGRRVAENASGGTDHGTAASHLLLGGRVRGGLVGQPPSLTDLEGGDLRHGIDFRRLYAEVARHWWNLPLAATGPLEPFVPLGLVG